jgi:hypothetical protein
MDPMRRLYRASLLPILFGCDLFGRTEGDAYSDLRLGFDQGESEAMRAGHRFERTILEELVEAAGVSWWHQTFESRLRPDLGLSATPDAIATVGGRKAVLEVKLVGSHMADHWFDGLPKAVRLQVLGQLLVWDREVGLVGASIGGRVRVFEVERDPATEAEIATRCRVFVGRYLEGDEVPPDLPDEFVLSVAMPEGTRIAEGDMLELGDRLANLNAQVADLKRLQEGVRARLSAAMAESDVRLLTSPLWAAEAVERASGKTTITLRRRRSLES